MKTLLSTSYKVVWSLKMAIAAYAVVAGSAVNPTHPYNLVIFVALGIGFVSCWFRRSRLMAISGLCGLVVSSMTLFQIYTLFQMFSGLENFSFRCQVGPFELTGWAAYTYFVIPVSLLILSIWAIGKSRVLNSLVTEPENWPETTREPFDYARYSVGELLDVSKNIDREAYPDRYQQVMAELEKRKGSS